MDYLLSMKSSYYAQISNYFKEPCPNRKTAFLLSRISSGESSHEIDVTDFIGGCTTNSVLQAANGLWFESPTLMNAIDMAMESCKSILYLYAEPDPPEGGGINAFDSLYTRVLFRTAYHYLPFGLHTCLGFNRNKLHGSAWLADLSAEPMQIQISQN